MIEGSPSRTAFMTALQRGYHNACAAEPKILNDNLALDLAGVSSAEAKVFIDNLIKKDEATVSKLSDEEKTKLETILKEIVPSEKFMVQLEAMDSNSAPFMITQPEFMRRMKDMAGMGGGGMTAFYAQMPDEVHLTVNGNHPIFQTLLKESDVDKQQKQARNLADLALLSQGLLKGAELTNFINRSVDLLK